MVNCVLHKFFLTQSYEQENFDINTWHGGMVVSWLVPSSPDRVVQVRGLAGDTFLSQCLSQPRCTCINS